MKARDKILNSIKPVIKNSKHVKINRNEIKILAQKLLDIPIPSWDNDLQFKGNPEETAQYYFFLDSINFCFWAKKGKDKWSYLVKEKWLTGYYAYSYAIKEAILKNPKLLNAAYLSNISFDEFSRIFKSKGKLLLLKKRHEIVKENFRSLGRNFEGQASKLIRKAKGDVNILVRLLLKYFPSFRDAAYYKRKKVYLLKRAQIFVSDLYYSFENKNLGHFKNLDDLSIFADYKLPQLLHAEKVLEYNNNLLIKIRNEELIKAGSEEEIEIRANTIFACELIIKEIQELGRNININELDWILWVMAKKIKFSLPHHKTLTIFY